MEKHSCKMLNRVPGSKTNMFSISLFIVMVLMFVWNIIKKNSGSGDWYFWSTLGVAFFDNLENQNFMASFPEWCLSFWFYESSSLSIVFLFCCMAYCGVGNLWHWWQQWYLRELWCVFLLAFPFLSFLSLSHSLPPSIPLPPFLPSSLFLFL